MADPYAARDALAAGEQPADREQARELVEGLGGRCAVELGDLAGEPEPAAGGFVGVVVDDDGPLPPVAAIEPAFAVLVLLRSPDGCHVANDALAALEAGGPRLYLLKRGLVAGPAGREGAFTVGTELIEAVIGRELAGEVGWERDPDFGYSVAASVPGVEGTAADALCPRLLYAANDRVYEHAETVVALKRERHRRASAVPGLDARIVAASGWPIEPTGEQWKE